DAVAQVGGADDDSTALVIAARDNALDAEQGLGRFAGDEGPGDEPPPPLDAGGTHLHPAAATGMARAQDQVGTVVRRHVVTEGGVDPRDQVVERQAARAAYIHVDERAAVNGHFQLVP